MKTTISEQINKIAAKYNGKNYSTITGKIWDLLNKKGFSSINEGCTLGPTTISWNMYQNKKEKVKVIQTSYPSGKTVIKAYQY